MNQVLPEVEAGYKPACIEGDDAAAVLAFPERI